MKNYTDALIEELLNEKGYKSWVLESKKQLVEAIQKLGDNKGYIVNEYELRDLILNKPKAYRILYDANINKYLVGDADDVIHEDLLLQAIKDGWYLEAKNDDELVQSLIDYMNSPRNRSHGTYDYNYTDYGVYGREMDDGDWTNPYLVYMIWAPDGANKEDIAESAYSDGYNGEETYEGLGTMYTRDAGQWDYQINAIHKLLSKVNKK